MLYYENCCIFVSVSKFWGKYVERIVKPVYLEGGMAAFQQQFAQFHDEWLPVHPEFKWADNACCMEWYRGTDISSLDYQCGIMMPLAD